MGQDLVTQFASAAAVFDEVGEALSIDTRALCFELAEDELRRTENAQLALFTCGVAAWRALEAETGIRPAAFAGHSVGEYAAIVAAGAVSLADGARLVRTRGELMAQAPAGTMAAILGLEREALQAVCESVEGVVVIANDNCPGQLVISGAVDAVPVACEKAVAAGAKRALPLNVSGAFHSPLMGDAAAKMGVALAGATWTEQHTPVYANVTAAPVASSGEWQTLLRDQLERSVRWTESVVAMRTAGITTFIECGVGEVLTGLLKRIDREARGIAVFDAASLAAAKERGEIA